MRTSRIASQQYAISGYTKADQLVQYTITKNGHGWTVDLIYGAGAIFNTLFCTKTEAVQAITNQG